MATFAPNLPDTNDPNWLGWSKSIERPQSNTSMAHLGETIGSNLEAGAKGLDKIAGQYAEEKGYERGNQEMDAAIQNVDQLKDQLSGKNISGGQGNDSLIGGAAGPGQPDQLPDEVQAGLSYGQKLADGRGDGKLSKTYTDAAMMVAQKDLRSQFPTYRNQVDQGFARATGRTHTANDYYNATLNDINSLLTAKDKTKDQTITHLFSVIGEAGVPDMIKQIQAGTKTPQDGIDLLGKVHGFHQQIKNDNEVLENSRLNATEKQRLAVDNFTQHASTEVSNQLNAVYSGPFGMKSYKDILEEIHGQMSGTRPRNQQALQQLSESLAQFKSIVSAKLYKDARANGSYNLMGDKADETIQRTLKQFDVDQSWIKDDLVGPLVATNKWMSAVQSDRRAQALASPLGIDASLLDAVRHISGGNELIPEVTKNLLVKGLPDHISGLQQGFMARAILTPEELNAGRPAPVKKTTMADDFNSLKPISQDKLTYSSFIEHTTNLMFGNLDDKHKAEVAKYLYDPKNIGILNTWQRAGQPGIFTTMSSPAMTQQMFKLDKTVPGAWDMYKNWTTKTFETLAQKDVMDLNQYQRLAGEQLTYNDKDNKFEYKGKTGIDRLRGGIDLSRNPYVVQHVDNINRVLGVAGEIAKAEGSDPTKYIYEVLKHLGYDLTDAPKSFATDMANAVRATKAEAEAKRQKTIEMLKKKSDKENPR